MYAIRSYYESRSTNSAAGKRRKITHTVAAGESLWTIARKHHVETKELAKKVKDTAARLRDLDRDIRHYQK